MVRSPKSPANDAPGVIHEIESRDGSGTLDLEDVRRRDPKALSSLFERYFDRLFGLAYRALGDRPAAEDAIQEVFLRIYRGAPTLDVSRDPGPWLTTITMNVCRDYWRSSPYRLGRASRPIDGTPDLERTLALRSDRPEHDGVSERGRLVKEAVLSLRPPLREVILLREYEGLGYEEIARIIGTNEAAARKRFSRALDELGRRLKRVVL